jgi:PIN domain nuclease of toxin-antitoxin system
LLAIDHHHAVADVDPEPATRDPFDRLLLAQCAIENMRLMTTDRVLAGHPFAWQPA